MQSYQLIKNLKDLYRPPLTESQEGFYMEFLSSYTDNQLDELWQVTMESHTYASTPTIGKLKEYAKQVTKLVVINTAEEARKRLTDEDIFATHLGQLSLKQGWADSYRIVCRETGIPEQGDDVLLKFQQGQQNARDAERELGSMKGLFAKTLWNMRRAMVEKNLELREKHAPQLKIAAI